MTSEEIIQRLLDEDKITVKEAMVILKDLAKLSLQQLVQLTGKPNKRDPEKIVPFDPERIVCMYGVTLPNDIMYEQNITNLSETTKNENNL